METFVAPPKTFFKYVYDVFYNTKKSNIDSFLAHLNSTEPVTLFTVEDKRTTFLLFWMCFVKRGKKGEWR